MSEQPSAQAGTADEGSLYDNVRHANQTLHNHSATANDLRNALRILFLCFNGLQDELAEVRDVLAETQVELAGAKADKRTRRKKRSAGEAEEGEDNTTDLVSSLAKFYVLFVTPYTGGHLFEGVTSESVGWMHDDVDTRFDEQFPKNRRVGEALDLLHYAVDSLKPLIVGMDYEFITLFKASAEAKRSEAARRGRDNGPEIFELLRDRVDTEIKQLKAEGVDLSFKRGKAGSESVSVLGKFCKDLFIPAASVCRKKLKTLLDFIGVSETAPGVYSSDAFCNLIYRSYKRIAGDEFLAEVLFRFARAIVYGPSYIDRLADLVMNANSPISGFALQATPGFVALICILARIVLSPDGSFTRDGKGPVTSIMWINDFELYLYVLTSIWDEDGGKVIAAEWNKNVFPRIARQNDGPVVTAVTPTPATVSQVRETAEDIIARNRAARLRREQDEEEVQFTFPTDHDMNDDSLHIALENTRQEEHSDEEHDEEPGFFIPPTSPFRTAQPNVDTGTSSLSLELPNAFEPEQISTRSQTHQSQISTPAHGARSGAQSSVLLSLSDSPSQREGPSAQPPTPSDQVNTLGPSIAPQRPVVARRTTRSTRNDNQATQNHNGVEFDLAAGVAQLSVAVDSSQDPAPPRTKPGRGRGAGGAARGPKSRKGKVAT